MIERVRDAIRDKLSALGWHTEAERLALNDALARAAIEAMLPSTEAMDAAGDEARGEGVPGDRLEIANIYRAMIDAALNPGDRT